MVGGVTRVTEIMLQWPDTGEVMEAKMALFHNPAHKSLKDYSDTNTRIHEFFDSKLAGVLATVDQNGLPDAAVVYYSIDEHLNVRFMTKKRTKKSENLQRNKFATFLVYDEETQTTAHVKGEVAIIEDENEANEVFRVTLRSSIYTSGKAVPPISKLSAGDYIAYRIVPSEISMAVFTRNDIGDYQRLFEAADLSEALL